MELPERAHPRYAVEIEVNCRTSGMFTSNQVMNLSRGGLFMKTESPMPIQAEVELVLVLPTRRIQAKGRVIWNYDMAKGSVRLVSGSGIRFVDMSPRDRDELESYLHELARAAGPRSHAPQPALHANSGA